MGTSVIITMSKCISCISVLVIFFILWAFVKIYIFTFYLSTENCCVISCMLLVHSCWRIGSCFLRIWICWSLLWTHNFNSFFFHNTTPPPTVMMMSMGLHLFAYLNETITTCVTLLETWETRACSLNTQRIGGYACLPLSFSAWLVCLARAVPVLWLQSLTKHLVPDRV